MLAARWERTPPPDEAKSAGWASPADVFADDKTRSYLDVFSFVEVGEDRPALVKAATETCGLLTCKCVCECSTQLTKADGSYWYADMTAQMDAFLEIVMTELIKAMRKDRAPGGDSFGVEQLQLWRDGNELTLVEQYESQDALLAHFGMVVTHTFRGQHL